MKKLGRPAKKESEKAVLWPIKWPPKLLRRFKSKATKGKRSAIIHELVEKWLSGQT